MKNAMTCGSKIIQIPGPNHKISTVPFVVNEDKVITVKIDSVSSGIVTGHKIWDEAGTPTSFTANMAYNALSGTPADDELTVGQYTKFHRVPVSIASNEWLCFVDKTEEIAVGNDQFVFKYAQNISGTYFEDSVFDPHRCWINTSLKWKWGRYPVFSYADSGMTGKETHLRTDYASGWILQFWKNYDSATLTYSGLFFEIDENDVYHIAGTAGWSAVILGDVPQNGQLVSKMESLVPSGEDYYTPCPTGTKYFLTVKELAGTNLISTATGGSSTTLLDSNKTLLGLVAIGDTVKIDIDGLGTIETRIVTDMDPVDINKLVLDVGTAVTAGMAYEVVFPTRTASQYYASDNIYLPYASWQFPVNSGSPPTPRCYETTGSNGSGSVDIVMYINNESGGNSDYRYDNNPDPTWIDDTRTSADYVIIGNITSNYPLGGLEIPGWEEMGVKRAYYAGTITRSSDTLSLDADWRNWWVAEETSPGVVEWTHPQPTFDWLGYPEKWFALGILIYYERKDSIRYIYSKNGWSYGYFLP